MLNMRTISQQELPIEGGIERRLLAGEDTIAVIFFLPPSPDTLVVWPLANNAKLGNVLDEFASVFLHRRSPPFAGADIEYWIGDHYTRSVIPDLKGHVHWILEVLDLDARELRASLELLRLTCNGICIELTFSDRPHDTDRAAIAAVDFDVAELSEFLKRFHPNRAIRNDEAELDEAFRNVLRWPRVFGADSQVSSDGE